MLNSGRVLLFANKLDCVGVAASDEAGLPIARVGFGKQRCRFDLCRMRMNVFVWLHTRSCLPTTNELSLVSPARFLPASVRRESHPLNRLFTKPQVAARNTRGNSIGIFPLLRRPVWMRVWSV